MKERIFTPVFRSGFITITVSDKNSSAGYLAF